MAGTRLAIQTLVVVQLVALITVSVHYGFCRSGCPRGNLTKDFPLVPGAISTTDNAAVVEPQLWEEIVCHPIYTLLHVLDEGYSDKENHGGDAENEPTCAAESDGLSDHRLAMTLVLENATDLSPWIDMLSMELDESDSAEVSTFSVLLNKNPMGLKVLPPLEDEDPLARWSHYNNHASSRRDRHEEQDHRLVIYIPAKVFPDDAILWKAFDAVPGEEETQIRAPGVATLVLPYNGTDHPTPSSLAKLQPLIEDWMARALLSDEENPRPASTASTKKKIRLTREFPLEHFLAILLPLIFPLCMPMVISWIKEYKRYKKLTAAKATKERLESPETKTTASAGATSALTSPKNE